MEPEVRCRLSSEPEGLEGLEVLLLAAAAVVGPMPVDMQVVLVEPEGLAGVAAVEETGILWEPEAAEERGEVTAILVGHMPEGAAVAQGLGAQCLYKQGQFRW